MSVFYCFKLCRQFEISVLNGDFVARRDCLNKPNPGKDFPQAVSHGSW